MDSHGAGVPAASTSGQVSSGTPWKGVGSRVRAPVRVRQLHERFSAWSPHRFSFSFVTIVVMLACGVVMTEECAAVEGARRRSLWSHGYRHKGSDGALRHRTHEKA